MRRVLVTAIALSLVLAGCYQGDSSQEDLVGFVVPLGEMGLSVDAEAIEFWGNWSPIEEEEEVVFSWDLEGQSFFAGLRVSCGDTDLLLQSLNWRIMGPVGAEVLVLEPVFVDDPEALGFCEASLLVRSLTKDGHGSMARCRVAGLEKGAWGRELLQMEAGALMTGQVLIEDAGDAELRLRLPLHALVLKPESGSAGEQLLGSLPMGEELVLEQFDGGEPEWITLVTFELSGEGERLTISLP
ncbi:MAG: hypothetical protein JRF33_22530 [Deltaproteobacteria bacterium]|nr:hypothetical protein [Deltaproteobacteria bacterium]